MTAADALISLLLCPPPVLVVVACYWRAIRLVNNRTPQTDRKTARLMRRLIFVVGGAGIIWIAGAVIVTVALVLPHAADLDVELAVIVHAAVGFLLGMAAIPLANLRSALQRTDLEDVDHDPIELDRALRRVELIFWICVCGLLVGIATTSGILLFGVLLFGLIPLALWQRRRAREGQFLWLLALSVRNSHNLAQEVQDHASTWTGTYAVRLRQLAVYLKAGRPLGLALERVPGLLPLWVVASIKIGEETGSLSEVLNECATAELSWMKNRFRTGSIGSLLIYLACYPWVILAPVTFIMYFIVPKFKAIFEGFGTDLPSATRNFIHVYDNGLTLILLLAPLSLIGVIVLLRFDHAGWRNVRLRLFRMFYPRFDVAPIMRHLARTIEKGKTLPDGLLAIANSYHRPTVAESVAQVYVEAESGGDCWKSLLAKGYLSRRDLTLIEAAKRSGNLPWALREIADVREKNFIFRIDTFVQLFRPVPILAIGLLVGWICIAMFMPVVKLVNDLS